MAYGNNQIRQHCNIMQLAYKWLNHLAEEESVGCCSFLVSCLLDAMWLLSLFTLPRGAVGWSAMRDCDIS